MITLISPHYVYAVEHDAPVDWEFQSIDAIFTTIEAAQAYLRSKQARDAYTNQYLTVRRYRVYASAKEL